MWKVSERSADFESAAEDGSPLVHALDAPRHPNEKMAALSRLTPRQQEVFALLCQGLSNKHICRRLNIAQPTVKAHVSAILRATGATNRVEAVVWAVRPQFDVAGRGLL